MKNLLLALAAVVLVATLLPFARSQAWWVRAFDFPRVQIAALGLLVLALHVARGGDGPGAGALRGVLLGCLALQAWRIRPYTRLARRQVQDARPPQAADPRRHLRLMFANVLQPSQGHDQLLRLVREADPDIFLALETDQRWLDALRPLLDEWRYAVLQPQDNTYGMLLFSRLPLLEPELRFLIEPDVPSIHTRVRLRDGTEVWLHCLHPRPPAPAEADTARPRDAELLVVGRSIEARMAERPAPVVVMGDLNDVAWSHTSHLFLRTSGLLDPRVGRGFFNTFHAGHRLLRFPLDHFFHSVHFRLIDFRRGAFFGSDHFPVFIHLSLEPDAAAEQTAPKPDAEDRREAQEKIADGRVEGGNGTSAASATGSPGSKRSVDPFPTASTS